MTTSVTHLKAKDLEDRIVALTAKINDITYCKRIRDSFIRSRAAAKAHLTRLERKLKEETIVEAPPVKAPTETEAVKDINIVIKSSKTSADLGWTLPKSQPKKDDTPLYKVLVVHSNVNFNS